MKVVQMHPKGKRGRPRGQEIVDSWKHDFEEWYFENAPFGEATER